ncbi:hypothetical protein OF897_07005 [Chryseobacterium formosus]|uniref:Uncharacterized protein n=1 Tax=Chryseobacterium formosus TaxID=1537363 RepID=A0ABT3XNG1_9FLAO|nr:hypothetical protein [Chryseobacterium formosus]MCX8523669.1 hypothetical protein [Chryseobacterium formosus]
MAKLLSSSSSSILPISTYFIEDKCTLKIGVQEYKTILTYTLFLEEGKGSLYDAEIVRSDYKINGQKIDTKFLGIAHRYVDAMFPLKCKIKEYRLYVTNISDIQERIRKIDKEIQNAYHGDGIKHIRNNFLDAVENEDKLRSFIKQFSIMKVISLGMQKFEQRKVYQLQWNILPIGFSTWRGEIKYDKNLNRIIYEPKIQDAQEVMDSIIHYIHKHDYNVDLKQENVPLFADFYHKTEYTGKTGRIKKSETNICIDVENVFLYEQKITLKNI